MNPQFKHRFHIFKKQIQVHAKKYSDENKTVLSLQEEQHLYWWMTSGISLKGRCLALTRVY